MCDSGASREMQCFSTPPFSTARPYLSTCADVSSGAGALSLASGARQSARQIARHRLYIWGACSRGGVEAGTRGMSDKWAAGDLEQVGPKPEGGVESTHLARIRSHNDNRCHRRSRIMSFGDGRAGPTPSHLIVVAEVGAGGPKRLPDPSFARPILSRLSGRALASPSSQGPAFGGPLRPPRLSVAVPGCAAAGAPPAVAPHAPSVRAAPT